MGAEHDAVPDLDRLFADLAHPNPYIQTEAFTAMAEHWQAEAMPRLIALQSNQTRHGFGLPMLRHRREGLGLDVGIGVSQIGEQPIEVGHGVVFSTHVRDSSDEDATLKRRSGLGLAKPMISTRQKKGGPKASFQRSTESEPDQERALMA